MTSSDAFSSTFFLLQHSDLFMSDEDGCFLFLSKFRGALLTLIKLTTFVVACSSKIPVERILTKQSWIANCIWQGAFLGETTPMVCTKKKTRVEKEVISEWTSSIQNLWRFFHISGKDNPRRLKTKKKLIKISCLNRVTIVVHTIWYVSSLKWYDMICKKLEVSSFFLHGLVYTYTVIKLGRVQCERVVSNFGDRTRKIHTSRRETWRTWNPAVVLTNFTHLQSPVDDSQALFFLFQSTWNYTTEVSSCCREIIGVNSWVQMKCRAGDMESSKTHDSWPYGKTTI